MATKKKGPEKPTRAEQLIDEISDELRTAGLNPWRKDWFRHNCKRERQLLMPVRGFVR
jgi:hypothetical protein